MNDKRLHDSTDILTETLTASSLGFEKVGTTLAVFVTSMTSTSVLLHAFGVVFKNVDTAFLILVSLSGSSAFALAIGIALFSHKNDLGERMPRTVEFDGNQFVINWIENGSSKRQSCAACDLRWRFGTVSGDFCGMYMTYSDCLLVESVYPYEFPGIIAVGVAPNDRDRWLETLNNSGASRYQLPVSGLPRLLLVLLAFIAGGGVGYFIGNTAMLLNLGANGKACLGIGIAHLSVAFLGTSSLALFFDRKLSLRYGAEFRQYIMLNLGLHVILGTYLVIATQELFVVLACMFTSILLVSLTKRFISLNDWSRE